MIGVDMTPEMVEKGRKIAKDNSYDNVEFRLGEIEHLPLADNSADVVISNCVINLSTDKKQVLQEIYRVLKPGGRIAISDFALTANLPDPIKKDNKAYVNCISGAVLVSEYESLVKDASFSNINIEIVGPAICGDMESNEDLVNSNVSSELSNDNKEFLKKHVVSVYITATKHSTKCC